VLVEPPGSDVPHRRRSRYLRQSVLLPELRARPGNRPGEGAPPPGPPPVQAPARQDRPRQGRPPQGRPHQGRSHQDRPPQGRPRQARKAPPGRPAKRPSWAWRYRRLLFLVGLVGVAGLAGAAYILVHLPFPQAIVPGQPTLLTYANGKSLASFNGGTNREPVPLSKVPKVLVDAVLATEDHAYLKHGAIDPVGIARATLADLRGRPVQGGSTITQQYVKQTYVGDQRSPLRKAKEAVLALKLQHQLTKAQILQRYLNIIYFGRRAYGVQAAAQAYFGKDVGQLSLDQAAYLAALIRSPETADAYRDPATAIHRRALTLDSMVRYHFISGPQSEQAKMVAMTGTGGDVVPNITRVRVSAVPGTEYFVQFVRQQLISRYGEAEVDGGGLRVQTSLDPTSQDQAYNAVYGFLSRGEPAGALVAIDDQGRVRAMVGGRNYADSNVNLAVGTSGGGSGRQPGSTFKAFLLAAAVKEGYSVESALPAPPKLVIPVPGTPGYPVTNFESESFPGPIDLVTATRDSVNTVYAQLEADLGAGKLVSMAHQLGVTAPLQPVPSLVLGTDEVSVMDMASAYSTFANEGVRITPRVVVQVATSDGRILQPDQAQRTRVLTQEQAAVVDYCLQQVVKNGTGTGAAIGRPLAGKTGTTEHYSDAWFVGYTPHLTTAVWMGYPDKESHYMADVRGTGVTGGSLPADIFRRFMSVATEGQPTTDFPSPSTLGGKSVAGLLLPYSAPSSAPSLPLYSTSTTRAPYRSATTTSAPGGPVTRRRLSPSTTSSSGTTTPTTTKSTTTVATTAPAVRTASTAPK